MATTTAAAAELGEEESINKIGKLLICKFCGKKHTFGRKTCPAYGKECAICKEENHFAICCPRRSEGKRNLNDHRGKNKNLEERKKNVRCCEHENSETSESERDIIRAVEVVVSLCKSKNVLRGCISVRNGDEKFVKILAHWDTTASCCVIGEHNLKQIVKNPQYLPSNVKLKPFSGNSIRPVAETILNCKKEDKQFKVSFQVVHGHMDPILSANVCQALGLISVTADVKSIALRNPSKQNFLEKLVSEFDCIFEGDGRMPCKVRFKIDSDIVPVQESPRRIPIAVRKALKTELDQLEAGGIIEKSTHHSEWISNIVLQKKKIKTYEYV